MLFERDFVILPLTVEKFLKIDRTVVSQNTRDLLSAHIIPDFECEESEKARMVRACEKLSAIGTGVHYNDWQNMDPALGEEPNPGVQSRFFILCNFLLDFMQLPQVGYIRDTRNSQSIFIRRYLLDYNLNTIGDLQEKHITKERVRQKSELMRRAFSHYVHKRLRTINITTGTEV